VIAADLILAPPAERSREIAARVARARAMQAERYAAIGLPQLRTNADANGPPLEEMARTDSGGLALLRDAAEAVRLSASGYHRVFARRAYARRSHGADRLAACTPPRPYHIACLWTRCAARRERTPTS
jgi:magnesium chelatase family protein